MTDARLDGVSLLALGSGTPNRVIDAVHISALTTSNPARFVDHVEISALTKVPSPDASSDWALACLATGATNLWPCDDFGGTWKDVIGAASGGFTGDFLYRQPSMRDGIAKFNWRGLGSAGGVGGYATTAPLTFGSSWSIEFLFSVMGRLIAGTPRGILQHSGGESVLMLRAGDSGMRSGQVDFLVGGVRFSDPGASFDFKEGRSYNIGITFDAGTVQLFIDSVLVATKTGATNLAVGSLMALYDYDTARCMDASVGGLAFYAGKVLTQAEIASHHSKLTPKYVWVDSTSAATDNDRQTYLNLFDGSKTTQYRSGSGVPTATFTWKYPSAKQISSYVITSAANSGQTSDPKNWTLQGSNDNQNWTTLDTRVNNAFASRSTDYSFLVATPTAYSHYKLSVTANNGDTSLQMSELAVTVDPPPPLTPSMGFWGILQSWS